MKKLNVDYELTDSTTGTVRILAIDKVRFERTARTNNWPIEDGPRGGSLMLFHALTRTGVIPQGTDFDTFLDTILVDFAPHNEDTEDTTGEADPTR